MSTYFSRQQLSSGKSQSPLFTDLCTFVGAKLHGSLGWFDAFGPASIPEWDPAVAARMNEHGFSFMSLPDGSMLVLLETGVAGAPPAVVYLGSEGEYHTVANSLEEFLMRWSTGVTGVGELDADDEEINGRKDLAAWIKKQNVKLPAAPEFDFEVWLDGGATAPTTVSAQAVRQPTAHYEKLGPKLRQLVDMMGRRADDEGLIAWVTHTLGEKMPAQTSSENTSVQAPTLGLELSFSQKILNDKYPQIQKSSRSFVPYLSYAWVLEKVGEPVFGIDLKKATEADVVHALGEPDGRRLAFSSDKEPTIAYWHRVVDAGADVVMMVESDDGIAVTVFIPTGRALKEFMDISTHVFVAWAAEQGLLDESRFAVHADLLARVRTRQALGSDLVKAALPRGLWDDHLIDNPDLRDTAFRWFHNMRGLWIKRDLKEIFGSREGAHGHDEPILDDDSWNNVDVAAKAFDKVFGTWVKTS